MVQGSAGPGPAHNHMLRLDPEEVIFGSAIRLNHVYSQCIRISNPLTCAVDLEVTPGNADRFSVHPDRLRLAAGEQALVEIRLQLKKPIPRPRGRHSQDESHTHRDIFHIKSSYFKQKFFALFSVWGALPVPDLKLNGGASAAVLPINRAGKPVADPPQRSPASPDADTRRAAPPSLPSAPAKRDETASPPTTNGLPHQMQARDAELAGLSAANTELTCKLDVLRQQCDYLGRKAKSFDDITSMMASDMPEVAAMVDLMMERERDDNEQKNAKVLQILRAKDTQIRDLEDKVRHTADDCLVKASAIVELQKSLEAMSSESETLRTKLADAQAEIVLKEAKYAEQVDRLQAQLREQTKSLDNNDQAMDQLQIENAGLADRLKTAKQSLRELKANGDPKALIEQIERHRKEAAEIARRHQAEVTKLKATISHQKEQIAGTADSNALLKRCEKECNRLKDRIRQLEEANEELKAETSALSDKLDDAHRSVSAMEGAVEKSKEEAARASERASERNVDRLELDLQRSRAETERIQAALDRLQEIHSKAQCSVLDHERHLQAEQDQGMELTERPSLSVIRQSIAALFNRTCNSAEEADLGVLQMIDRVHVAVDIADGKLRALRLSRDALQKRLAASEMEHARAIAELGANMQRVTFELRLAKLSKPTADDSCVPVDDTETADEIRRLQALCESLRKQLDAEAAASQKQADALQDDCREADAVARRMEAQSAEIERLRALVGSESDVSPALTMCHEPASYDSRLESLIRENEDQRTTIERCRIEAQQVATELQAERDYAAHAERRIADLQASLDLMRSGLTCGCKDVPDDLDDHTLLAIPQPPPLEPVLERQPVERPPECDEASVQTPGKAGPDSCQRIEQLEGELVDCRAYTDILLRTIDALQGGEENRRLQEKNAQIVTLAAQLSATKAQEAGALRRLREANVLTAKAQQPSTLLRSRVHQLEDRVFRLQRDVQQRQASSAALDAYCATLQAHARQQAKRIEMLQGKHRELRKAEEVIRVLREEVRDQRERYGSQLDRLREQFDRERLQGTTICPDCADRSQERLDAGLAAIESMSALVEGLEAKCESTRLAALVDVFREQFLEQERSGQRLRSEHRLHRQRYVLARQQISRLECAVDALRTELGICQQSAAAQQQTVPDDPVRCGTAPPALPAVVRLDAAIEAEYLAQVATDRALRHVDSLIADTDAQVAQAVHDCQVAHAKSIGSRMSSLEKFIDALPSCGGSGRDDDLRTITHHVAALKVVESELLERLDASNRLNDSLQSECALHRRTVAELEARLAEADQRDMVLVAPADKLPVVAGQTINNGAATTCDQSTETEPGAPTTERVESMSQTDTVACANADVQATVDNEADLHPEQKVIHSCEVSDATLPRRGPFPGDARTSPDRPVHTNAEGHSSRAVSSCSLKDVIIARSILQEMSKHVTILISACTSLDGQEVDINAVRDTVQHEARQIGNSWKQMEPTICALCDERTKLMLGVEMLRSQLNTFREMKLKLSARPTFSLASTQTSSLVTRHTGTDTAETSVRPPDEIVDMTDALIAELESERRHLSEEVSRLHRRNDLLQSEANSLHDILSRQQNEKSSEQSHTEEPSEKYWKRRHRLVKHKCDGLRAEVEQLRAKVEALEAAHEAELKALKASFADERTHLMAVHENRIERHRKSVEQRVLAETEQQLNDLKSRADAELALHAAQFEALLNEFEKFRIDHDQAVNGYEERIHQLTSSAAKCEGKAPKMKLVDPCGPTSPRNACEEIEELQQQIEQERQKAAEAKQKLSASVAQCKVLRKQLAHQAQQMAATVPVSRSVSPSVKTRSVSPDRGVFAKQIARLESKVQQQKTQIKTLTDTITSNADGIAGKQRLQAQFDQQQNELHEKDKKAQPLIGLPVKHLQQLVSARDKTIADLRERLARLVDADNEVRSASLKVHEKIYSMSAELARKQARVKELQAKVEKLEARLSELSDVQASFHKVKSDLQRKDSALQVANDQLRQLRVERAKSQELIDKLQADLQGRKRDASRLNKVRQEAALRSDQYREALMRLGNEWLEVIAKLKARLAQRQSEMTLSSNKVEFDASSVSDAVPEFSLNELEDLLVASSGSIPARRDVPVVNRDVSETLDRLSSASDLYETWTSWNNERISLERQLALSVPVLSQ
ncbi:hypothetical protein PBRA_006220 [Plasmodiophora brassicae]|uniref:Uncharacterized protein n=1 Tax=Plasmodiophora brassicae TaxID=37360 RepID=A0A0G4ISN7_PLABS|nr:hypothetical protein PBRA_006220 [Plasmodiophora brassicae]